MLKTMIVFKDGSVRFDLKLKELKTQANEIDWYWTDFSEPNNAECGSLQSFFGFNAIAVRDCLNFIKRPKMDYYDGYRFIVLHALKEDMKIEEVNMFLSPNHVVTFCRHKNKEIQAAWQKIALAKMTDLRPEDILHLILDEISDNFFPIVQDIEDEIQEIDEQGSDSDQSMIDGIREQLSRLSRLRKTVKPMKDLLYRILNSSHVKICEKTHFKLQGVYDHLVKLLDDISDNRELANDIRESYISTNSHKMNRIMKTLTSVSMIFMPLTFIVGVYGMNFDNMPELHAHNSYFIVWTIMIVIVFGLCVWFKKKDWF